MATVRRDGGHWAVAPSQAKDAKSVGRQAHRRHSDVHREQRIAAVLLGSGGGFGHHDPPGLGTWGFVGCLGQWGVTAPLDHWAGGHAGTPLCGTSIKALRVRSLCSGDTGDRRACSICVEPGWLGECESLAIRVPRPAAPLWCSQPETRAQDPESAISTPCGVLAAWNREFSRALNAAEARNGATRA